MVTTAAPRTDATEGSRRPTPITAASRWNLTFSQESALEPVYLVYTAEKNRGLTLRLHFMLIAAWAVGALKTVSQGLYAYKLSGSAMLPRFSFLLLAQLVNFGYQLASIKVLKSVARHDQLQQEHTKAWLHILLDVAVMVCVILSDPTLPHSPVPLSTMIVTSFLAVLDVLRLDTLVQLCAIKWLCFAFLEADHYMRAPRATLGRVGVDTLYALAFGTLLPLAVAAVSEAYQREAFLRDCRKPPEILGPFWSALLKALRNVPGLRAPPPTQDPHTD